MTDSSRISLNTATVKAQWSLAQCIEGCARHGFGGIAPWRDVLHDMGVKAAARRIRDAGLAVSGLCRGGLFTRDGECFSEVLDDNRRAVDEARDLGAACLVLVVGGLPHGSTDLFAAHAFIEDALHELLTYSRAAQVPLAIEPLHPMYAADRACVNTLTHANDICDRLGEGIGVAVDVYHTWWDRTLEREIARAGKRTLAFHICDWLRDTQHMLLDRGMMGDGVINVAGIRSWVEAAGFSGLYEVEIFSERTWWRADPDDVLGEIKARVAAQL